MKFLKEVGIRDFENVYANYKTTLGKELNESNITKDSNKNITLRGQNKVQISEYVKRIIRSNPAVLNTYGGILKIEYKQDGSRKNILELFEDFNKIETEEEKNSKYSIYYGIINERYEKLKDKDNIPQETHQKLNEFFERKSLLISADDMRYYYKNTDPSITKMVISNFERELKGEVAEKSFEKRDESDISKKQKRLEEINKQTMKGEGNDERD